MIHDSDLLRSHWKVIASSGRSTTESNLDYGLGRRWFAGRNSRAVARLCGGRGRPQSANARQTNACTPFVMHATSISIRTCARQRMS